MDIENWTISSEALRLQAEEGYDVGLLASDPQFYDQIEKTILHWC